MTASSLPRTFLDRIPEAFKDDAKEVAEGYECGVTLEKFADVKEGDVYEAFKMEEYRD